MERQQRAFGRVMMAAAVAGGWCAPALATPAPEPVAAMIAKAAESGDSATLNAVVAVAKQTNPESILEIDALVQALAGQREELSQEAAAPASNASAIAEAPAPPVPWKGSVELGGMLSQAASDVVGAYGSLDVTRKGPVWTQRATLRGDYQRTDGRTTTERLSAAYEPRARVSDSRYAFGLAQYERDRILGYMSRYTLGAGLGLQVADAKAFKLGVDFGPALRLTERRATGQEHTVAARGSLNLRWLPTDRVTVSEEGAVYTDKDQASAKSITSLETLLFGPLKARLSYHLQYERNPAENRIALDTTTRASLVYAF